MEQKEIGNKIYVKQEMSWYVMDDILEWIKSLGTVITDREFLKCYREMRRIVYERIELPTNYRVEDVYVIVEQAKGKY